MELDSQRTRQLLNDFELTKLFIEELGWDRLKVGQTVSVDGTCYSLSPVAEKRGVQIYECSGNTIPNYPLRQKIDRQLRKLAHEHLIIFTDTDHTTQIWQWVARQQGKPAAYREYAFHRSDSADFLIQRLNGIAFPLSAEEGLDITGVTTALRDSLDREKVTKRFYDYFKAEHDEFKKFLKAIPVEADQRWYASVMLNRLMFIYFIQSKGFLNGDNDYLKNKLAESEQRGKDRFYSDFLCPLFFQGFAERKRSKKIEALLGDVPYLNGGIFQKHQLEEKHGKKIQIPDRAFHRLFAFFDSYRWHLDERPLRNHNEINPDILGYIFEKYINQKQMGAYYTKEDITEYISKNTIIPYLFDAARPKCRIAFEGEHSIWGLLRADPDRYIYPAIRHGVDLPLPEEIAIGIDDVSERTEWNKAAPAEYALPTEIWREVVARRQRYQEVRGKLEAGEIREINDLITYNLNIRQFAQDVIQDCEGPELLRAFWKAIEGVTVLDPTCGSGAFLFAALNILEPLYEACLDRMEAFVEELDRSGDKHHPEKFSDFRKVLARIEEHPNRKYYVFKSIIIKNLYGVDIMEEAVEICKLRLFLKLVAQVDKDTSKPNWGVEPLPDIDFNIRAGNTLVGYATLEQTKAAVTGKLDFDKAWEKIEIRVADLQQDFNNFREYQLQGDGSVPTQHKILVHQRLEALNSELNSHLLRQCGVKSKDAVRLESWYGVHKPYHWFVEFRDIIEEGGFSVVIGNPPYAEVPKKLNRSLLRSAYRTAAKQWSRDEDLYTMIVERSLHLLEPSAGRFGMILPLSMSFSTKQPFVAFRKVMAAERGLWLWSHFDRIPSALFGNEVRTRCSIALLSRTPNLQARHQATTSLLRWNSEFRGHLFMTLRYSYLDVDISEGIPKVSSQLQANTLSKLLNADTPLAFDLRTSIPFNRLAASAPQFPQPCVYVGGTAYNWFPAWREIPETASADGSPSLPARTAGYRFADENTANIVFALLCSSLGYWWWAVASDGFNLKKWLLNRFPLSVSMVPPSVQQQLAWLGGKLQHTLKSQYVYKDNKGRIGNFFLPGCAEETAAIDTVLGQSVPMLSPEFMEDVRTFNASFSRSSVEDVESDV